MAKEGRAPNRDWEWPAIKKARDRALEQCTLAARTCEAARKYLLSSRDPRFNASAQAGQAFKAHFKSESPGDAREIKEGFDVLKVAIAALEFTSFRVVPQPPPDARGTHVYAYVRGLEAIVYITDRWLDEVRPQTTAVRRTPRSQVSGGSVEVLGTEGRAATMIHEAAHYRLGVAHLGGEFSADVWACDVGYALKSFSQASMNAYCYDHFARCVAAGEIEAPAD